GGGERRQRRPIASAPAKEARFRGARTEGRRRTGASGGWPDRSGRRPRTSSGGARGRPPAGDTPAGQGGGGRGRGGRRGRGARARADRVRACRAPRATPGGEGPPEGRAPPPRARRALTAASPPRARRALTA